MKSVGLRSQASKIEAWKKKIKSYDGVTQAHKEEVRAEMASNKKVNRIQTFAPETICFNSISPVKSKKHSFAFGTAAKIRGAESRPKQSANEEPTAPIEAKLLQSRFSFNPQLA